MHGCMNERVCLCWFHAGGLVEHAAEGSVLIERRWVGFEFNLNANVSHGFVLHPHDAHCLGTRPCLPRQPTDKRNDYR